MCISPPKRQRLSRSSREPCGKWTWGGIRTCPNSNCGSSDTVPFPSTDTPYRCLPCGQLFSVRTKTEYDDGRPLWQWLLDHEFMLYENDGLSREQAATKMFEEFQGRTTLQCPRCGSLEVSEVSSAEPMPYHCRPCRKYFSARTGTTLEGGRIPLGKWLDVIKFYGNEKRPTSVQLTEMLNVTQNMAWDYREELNKVFAKKVVP